MSAVPTVLSLNHDIALFSWPSVCPLDSEFVHVGKFVGYYRAREGSGCSASQLRVSGWYLSNKVLSSACYKYRAQLCLFERLYRQFLYQSCGFYSAPVAVGVATMSTEEMHHCGMKGKGVVISHWYTDNLW